MSKSLTLIAKWVFIIYFVIGILIWLFSPFVIRHIANSVIEPHKLALSSETSIRFNPFTIHLRVNELGIISLDNPEIEAISLAQLDFELRLHKLLFDEIYISELFIQGLNIKATLVDETLSIAGIPLNPQEQELPNDDNATVVESTKVTESDNAPFPYTVLLPALHLTDSKFDLEINKNSHNYTIKNLHITDLSGSLLQQEINLSLDSQINESSLQVDVRGALSNMVGELLIDINVQKIDLAKGQHLLPENIKSLNGDVSVKAKNKITLDGGLKLLEVSDFSLLIEHFNFSDDVYSAGFTEQLLKSKAITVDLNNIKSELNDFSLSYTLDDFLVTTSTNDDVVLSIGNIELPNITYAEPALNKVLISGLNINNVTVSDKLQDEKSALLSLSSVDINNIFLTQSSIDVGTVTLSDLLVEAEMDEEKVLVNLVDISKEQAVDDTLSEGAKPEVKEIRAAEEPTTHTPFNFSLAHFNFMTPAKINFVDRSVQPHYVQNMVVEKFDFTDINTRTPDVVSQLIVLGKSNKYAHFTADIKATPLALSPDYKINADFNEVSLPEISSYVREALEFEIESGQFDLKVDANINDSQLSGDADIILRGIEFKVQQEDEQKTHKSSVPFNIAIGMLKDSQGNVELNLPLSGDLSSPSFGMTGLVTLLVKQATMSAAKDYLMNTFVPYAAVVSVAISAGEYALKVSVNDLHFNPMQTELADQQKEFLTQISALLKEDKDLQIKLCGYSTPEDIGLPLAVEITNKDMVEKLNAMSKSRIENFKDFLIDKHQIKSSRLLLCKPRIDYEKDAKPSLKFVI